MLMDRNPHADSPGQVSEEGGEGVVHQGEVELKLVETLKVAFWAQQDLML